MEPGKSLGKSLGKKLGGVGIVGMVNTAAKRNAHEHKI